MARTALVTGANRGIGLEVARQLAREGMTVILCARDSDAGREAAARLSAEGGDVRAEMLDVADEASIRALADRLARAGVTVDALVNNAGIYPHGDLMTMATEKIDETMRVNTYGALWMTQAFAPGMIERGYGRVVNVSSGAGSFKGGLQGPPVYSFTKAALNAVTMVLAHEVRGDVKINAVCPGWVRTEMGGSNADRSVEEGARGIVWAATLPADGPNGGFFRDGKAISW
ncbi:SDR family oxidoreductase [bacterium]|nr:SDR family oxidoreductase [bacterium]MCB9478890.1 SDR family oxidoreductase [Deltaproteobacteria bacterium]